MATALNISKEEESLPFQSEELDLAEDGPVFAGTSCPLTVQMGIVKTVHFAWRRTRVRVGPWILSSLNDFK